MGWIEFCAAFAVFFLTHSVPIRPPVRPWLIARLGQHGFTLAYSALSLASLAWLIGAANRAPYVGLWSWAPWQSHLALTGMLAVCLIVALAIGKPNPFSFGGARNDRFDPARPGLVRFTRHPLLLAIGLWALVHILPNGDLAHVLLFGTFALFALIGVRLVDARRKREMGEEWHRLNAERRKTARIHLTARDLLRVAIGLLVYAALLWAHPVLFGVSPIPA
ncbi:NnrU family protein [Sedimentitalea arenosa]|uniref:NnrU family protein n=1 Tax=Sedimentitalea arenosa TaxID=2798803 RepID=A0A8J7J5C0_9RHOB|nr:NnrU family protein [Arenibacterium arenosum]MBJ6371870.1 NnrU family protein [Arenibacterium arenosum]